MQVLMSYEISRNSKNLPNFGQGYNMLKLDREILHMKIKSLVKYLPWIYFK